MNSIPFNKPYMTGNEIENIKNAHLNGVLAGNGFFSKMCAKWLENYSGSSNRAFLTHSCTAALEMAAIASNIQPGDEVIMPSYTFVSTANAFVLRGATPVFVDINPDTLNIDESLIEPLINCHTKAIVPVHYAGISCDMDRILNLSNKYQILVIEDAAQALMANYKNKPLGSLGQFGCFSFHETKNLISGEGGALLVESSPHADLAEIIWEKGTDRNKFFRGEVDKYTWQSKGSSFLPGELTAAFLAAQLDEANRITNERLRIWDYYHQIFEAFEEEGLVSRPKIPSYSKHNAHMYYLILSNSFERSEVLRELREQSIFAVSHYVPLHSSPAGLMYGKVGSSMDVTNHISDKIFRLPLWIGLTRSDQDRIAESLKNILKKH